jgi:pyridoxamine 5'-phosphate oxidase
MILDSLTALLSAHDLPDPAPPDPMPLFTAWYEDAHACGKYDYPNAMSLATATPDGCPSVRVVLCKGIEGDAGAVHFYTNYASRKGSELGSNPRAAVVFYWPHASRQARLEGSIEKLSDGENDAYFKQRPLISRIGANISRQSTPIQSRRQIVEAAVTLAKLAATGHEIQRPADWGGYRMRLNSVELWSGREGRLHQRVVWRRESTEPGAAWTSTLLSP